MGAPAAIGAGLTAATGLGTAINSGVKGHRASQALDARMQQSDMLNEQLVQRGLNQFSQLQSLAQSFANPQLSRQILNQAQSGGQQLALNNRTAAAQLANQGLLANARQLLGQGGMDGLMANLSRVTGGQGLQSFTPDAIHNPAALGAAVNLSRFQANEFSFDPTRQLTQQALDTALQGGERARASASEQAALGMRASGSALDAALASRGISRDSGVGAAATSQFAAQSGQALTQLERDLADQAQSAALSGAQLDAQNALTLSGQASQYNLGLNQLLGSLGAQRDALAVEQALGRGQLQLGRDSLIAEQQTARNNLMGQLSQANNSLAAQLAMAGQQNDLARSQAFAGLQAQRDQNVLNRTGLLNSAVTDPLQLLQTVYQQNHLAPQLSLSSSLAGAAGNLLASGMSGMQANLQARQQAVSQAGGGKGAGLGAMTGGIQSLPASPKVPTPVNLTANQPFARVL